MQKTTYTKRSWNPSSNSNPSHEKHPSRGLRSIFAFAAVLLIGLVGYAQTITVGTGSAISGTNDQGNPIYRSTAGSGFNFSQSGSLFTATDLAALPVGATINSFALNKNSAFSLSAGRTATLNIYMRNSAATSLANGNNWPTMISGATLVYSSATVNNTFLPAAPGFWTIPLQTPIVYTGGAIEIYIDWAINAGAGNPTGGTFTWAYDATAGTQALGAAGASALPTTITTWSIWSRRWHAQFTYTPAAPCSGTPTPGNTLSSVASACDGQNFTLSLQNFTSGSGVSYQWESADDISFAVNQTPLGTGSTQVISQTSPRYYRCTVDCPAGGGSPTSAQSAPLLVGIQGPFPVDFTPTGFPSNCWTSAGATLGRSAANGYGVAGTGSANFNFYNTGGGVELFLTSPSFPAVPAGWQVRFDGAGAAYTGGEIDRIFLETSATGPAGPWSVLQEVSNQPGGALNTFGGAGTTTARFVPGAAQWVTLSFAIPTGTNAIRFRGLSEFGNDMYLDNILVEEIPSCNPPANIAANATTSTSGLVTWLTALGETYDVEIRTSGLPGSGGLGLTLAAFGEAGPSYAAAPLLANTDYFAYVRSNCGGPLSAWSAAFPFRTGLCLASAGPDLGNDFNISNVSFADINNNSASTSSYEDFTSVVGNVVPGQTYSLSVTRGTNYTNDQVFAWINWNGDFDFDDANEQVLASIVTPANPTVINVTVPPGTPAGNVTMRIRRHNITLAGNSTPCGNSDVGQVEDYTISICGPSSATVSIVDDCANDAFDALVNIADFGSAGSGSITYTVSGGSPVTVAAVVGNNSLTALGMVATAADNVAITVENGSVCSLDLGTYFSNCADSLICTDPSVTYNYCYKTADTRTFHYVAEPGNTVSLDFVAGSIDLGDAISFFDGADEFAPSLGGGNFGGDLSIASATSTGTDLFMTITSPSGNSCFDGGQATPWQWTVQCSQDCSSPDGFVSTNSTTCGPDEFFLDVFVLDYGAEDAAQTMPLSAVDILWSVSGGASGSVDATSDFVTTIGPFPLGSSVNVTLGHLTNALCNNNLGNYTEANTCPPANDACVNAQVLTVNSIGGCPAGAVPGNTLFATPDATPAVTCNNGAGTIQDVWYTFNTGNFGNPIQVRFTAGTAVGYAAEFYPSAPGPTASCLGTSFGCLPNAAGGVNLNLTPNTNYYIRVFNNTATVGNNPGTFGICLAGSTCPAPTAPASASITDNSANISWTGAPGNYIIEYGPSVSFTVPGIGATAGAGGTVVTSTASPATITGLSPTTNYRFFVRRDCGGGNFSFNSAQGLFITLAPPPPPVAIAHATCAQNVLIPDNGCATNNALLATFPISTVGSNLGVDVTLQSVDLIINHTFRSDLQISLISPTGQVRSLINARGGAGLNFGNPADCSPTGFMRLIAGGAALGTLAVNNPTGNWAPEQAFTGLTGDPNGTWTVRICDSFGADVGTLDYVGLNFAPCAGPAFTLTATPDCGNNEYSVNVIISDMGTAASYNLTNSLNGNVVTATGVGSWSVGPFTSSVPVVITLVHNVNTLCNATTGSITFFCPPPNDLCADAIPIVGCNTVINGFTTNGTNTDAPADCGDYAAGTAAGVWYTVDGWDGDMTVTTCPGADFDTQVAVFTGPCNALACVAGNDDALCGLQSTASWTATSGTTYFVYVTGFGAGEGSFTLGVTCGSNEAACPVNGLTLEFQTDDFPEETTWEILDETGSVIVVQGGPLVAVNGIETQSACLPDGCYRLRVLDSFGDGMVTGGYELRESGANGRRIIDNTNNFSNGLESSIANGGTFCVPIGDISLINHNCDKLDWTNGKMLVCNRDAAVAAAWISGGSNSVQSSQTGYNWWIFDPNGSYSYKRFRSHRNNDGYPQGSSTNPARADRPAHFKINAWSNTALTPHIPENVMMNVRVRPFVNLTPTTDWGPACQMMIDPVRAACPLVWLQDDPINTSDFSCGVTRDFGGTNSSANRITAKPPQIVPQVWSGQVRFQFRFRIPAEGVCIVRPVQSSPVLYMNWSAASGPQLQISKTYEVEVRVSKDFGATWCVDSPSPACDPSPVTTWGKTCLVTIGNVVALQDESSSFMPTQGTSNLSMFPNPNNGNQLFLQLSEVAADVKTISVDIYDLTGKRITARTIAVQDGFVNTAMDLNGDIANGLYMVNITAGEKTWTERLVIQK